MQVDPFLLIITLILSLLLIFGNIYFIAYYSHHADSFFGSSTACKATLVVGYVVAQAQVLMLPLDVQNTREGTDFQMYMMWYVVAMISCFYVTFGLPFGLFYSETDEEKEFKWRICSAFKNQVVLLVILSILVFPAYSQLSYSDFPITVEQCSTETDLVPANLIVPKDATTECSQKDTELHVRVGFQIFMLSLMTFCGWCLLCIFLPTGMQAIPFDFAAQWVNRPRPMNESDFNTAKADLAKKVQTMLSMGKQLIEDKKRLAEQTRNNNMFSRWRAKSSLKSQQHQFEVNCVIAEREFQKLDKVASYSLKVEPLKYALKMGVALIMGFVSVLLLIHTFCFVALKVDGRVIEPFLNDMLEQMEISSIGFLASVAIVSFGLFMVVCALRGNVKLGLRFFFISFYPIVPKETFVNSFMANCLVMNLWMASLMQLINVLFRGYLRGTSVAKIWSVQVSNMQMFKWFFRGNFFIIWFIVWWFIALIYLILKPVEKINLGSGIKRADLKSKH